jgi:hypothetical protein
MGIASSDGTHCFRPYIPSIDFPRLFESMAEYLPNSGTMFAFCAADCDFDDQQLAEMAAAAGLRFAAVGSHLQKAVLWRNRSEATILAIARGEPPEASSIREFADASSADLGRAILTWTAEFMHDSIHEEHPTHLELLGLLATNPPAQMAVSLDAAARFAAAFTASHASEDAQTRSDAPLSALAELGVAWDAELCEPGGESLRKKLSRAIRDTDRALALDERQIASLERRIEQFPASDRRELESLPESIHNIQRATTPDRLRRVRLKHLRQMI